MADDDLQASEGSSAGKWILLALAALYVAGSLFFIFDLRGRLDKLSKDQTASTAPDCRSGQANAVRGSR